MRALEIKHHNVAWQNSLIKLEQKSDLSKEKQAFFIKISQNSLIKLVNISSIVHFIQNNLIINIVYYCENERIVHFQVAVNILIKQEPNSNTYVLYYNH